MRLVLGAQTILILQTEIEKFFSSTFRCFDDDVCFNLSFFYPFCFGCMHIKRMKSSLTRTDFIFQKKLKKKKETKSSKITKHT